MVLLDGLWSRVARRRHHSIIAVLKRGKVCKKLSRLPGRKEKNWSCHLSIDADRRPLKKVKAVTKEKPVITQMIMGFLVSGCRAAAYDFLLSNSVE